MTPRDPKTRTHWVWLISSLLLLTLWMLLVAAPFAQAAQDREATLPACCRAHGAHHCTGAVTQTLTQTSDAPAFTPASLHEHCPCTPAAGSSVLLGASALAERARHDAPTPTAQALCNTLFAADGHDSTGANPKRGPPASSHLR